MIDQFESMENAAELLLEQMTKDVPLGMFRCACGRVTAFAGAVAATPSPYAPPICTTCAYERGNPT